MEPLRVLLLQSPSLDAEKVKPLGVTWRHWVPPGGQTVSLSSHPPSQSERAGCHHLTAVSHSVLVTGRVAATGSPCERMNRACPPAWCCDPRTSFFDADCRVPQRASGIFSLPVSCPNTRRICGCSTKCHPGDVFFKDTWICSQLDISRILSDKFIRLQHLVSAYWCCYRGNWAE